jgi:hypothetical protein
LSNFSWKSTTNINLQIDRCYQKLVVLKTLLLSKIQSFFSGKNQTIMLNHNKQTSSKSSFYRLIAATLTIGGVSLLIPLIASAQALTPAGTPINNTATGTYEDPNNPGVPINTTSNTVTATVAEIAGITNVPAGTIDINGGSVTTNDGIDYGFLITNKGNEVSAFHIPGTAVIVGGTLGTTGSNIPVLDQKAANLFVTEVNGVVLTTPFPVPAAGLDTTLPAFITAVSGQIPGFNGSIPANGTIKVVVPVKVTETVANNPVSVTLGNVPPNDNSAATQNVADPIPTTGAGTDDVYTINFAGPAPVNGIREASAKDTQILATQVNNLALATVLKVRTAYNPAGVGLTDDTLTYRLDLRVETTAPAAGITPAPLLPTAIRLGGATVNRILVSDAIPVNTTLDLTFVEPTPPAGWTRVYSTVPTTTGPLDVTTQNWQTGALPAGVTRIGYIANSPIAPGTTTVSDANGFQFRVVTTGIPVAGGTVANIAQAFGQTTAGVVSPTNPLVYDESGDQNPNNFEAGIAPTPITAPATSPNGIADPAGTADTLNTNTGTGPAGEENIFTINPPGIILNGPAGQPGAIGPDATNNTDFVNKSAVDVPAGVPPFQANGVTPNTYDPAAITFVNTVQNPPSNTQKLDNVILEPISAAKALAATPTKTLADYELTAAQNGAPLINGTTVRIAYPVGSTPVSATGRTALYTLTAGNFVLTSSTTNGVADGVAAPIKIASLAVGSSQDYNVIIDLPAGSAITVGYSVPIVAYVDSNPLTAGFKNVAAEDTPFNIKIDRAYTGYLNLAKQSRILVGTGPALSVPADGTLSTTAKTPAPGNIIEYVITYKNISTAASGSGNVILDANKIVITEDGALPPNNWATFTTNVISSAVDATSGAVITYFVNGAASVTTDPAVTKYLDKIPTLAPAASGTFTFQRKVN